MCIVAGPVHCRPLDLSWSRGMCVPLDDTSDHGRQSKSDVGPRAPPSVPKNSPNVLVVLYDAVGCAGWSTYGGRIKMPTLDRLARNGLTYSQWHTSAVSAPADSCFLTGRNQHRYAFAELAGVGSDFTVDARRRPKEVATLASVLRDAGWSTCWIGRSHKEHCVASDMCAPKQSWQTDDGFVRFHDLGDGAPHAASDAADAAIEFLRDARSSSPSTAWYLSFCPGADHSVALVPRAYLDRYRGRFDDGYDAYRHWVLVRMIERGLLPRDTKLTPLGPAQERSSGETHTVRPWRTLSADERSRFSRVAEVYAATSEYADAQIGRIVAWLDDTGQLDNTLIVYGADSGASGVEMVDTSTNDIAFFDSFPVGLSGVKETLEVFGSRPSPNSEDDALGGWTAAFSTPHRVLDRSAGDGAGRSVPLVIHWPRGINARGEVRHQYHHCTDVVPTILECCGLAMPELVAGVPQSPLPGVSMRYTFEDASAATRKRTQYYEMPGTRGIWHDGWRATIGHAAMSSLIRPIDTERWHLFHTDADRSEAVDLAEQYPEKVRALSELWLAEGRKYGVQSHGDVAIMQFVKCETGVPVPVSGRYVYHPNTHELTETSATITQGRTFRVFAQIDIAAGAEGLICAQRSPFGGYALRLKGGKLRFEYDFFGISPQHDLVCDGPPLGRHVVGVEIAKQDHEHVDGPAGSVTIYVDGEPSACTPLHTMTGRFLLCGEGFTIGCDDADASHDEREASTSLVGARVIKVVFDVAEEAAMNAARTAGTKGQYVTRACSEYSSGAAVAAHILPR